MLTLGMYFPSFCADAEKAAALGRRLGLKFIMYEGERSGLKALEEKYSLCFISPQTGAEHFSLSMSDEEKEALLLRADRDSLSLVVEGRSEEELDKAVLWINLWRNRVCAPDELWDVYDRQGRLLGRTMRRGDSFIGDECHLCVHVWVKNSEGRFMLTKRSENKSLPGLWETTGGSVVAGEDSLSSAVREVYEETGFSIDAGQGRLLFRYGGDNFLCDVWLFPGDFDLEQARLLPGETCAIMYADEEKIRALCREDAFMPYSYLEDFLRGDYTAAQSSGRSWL